MSKPGYAKFASFRGPASSAPSADIRAFWVRELAASEEYLAEAVLAADTAQIKRARRQIAEAAKAVQITR
jgi:hypothetical protein